MVCPYRRRPIPFQPRCIPCSGFLRRNVFREMGDFWHVSGLYLRWILCLAFFEGNVFREMGDFWRVGGL